MGIMNKVQIIVALAILVSAPAIGKPLKFLTANVGNMTISSASHDRQFKISEYDLPVLKDNIAAINPDVVFLQEIDGKGKQQEKRIFGKKYQTRCSEDMCTAINGDVLEFIGECEGEGKGYLLCAARVLNSKKIEEKCSEEKTGYVCVSKRTLASNEVVKLFNVHGASPADDKGFSKRSGQICGILDMMKKFQKAGFIIITGGDFNFDPVYESKQYNKKNDRSDPLFNLNVCWGDMFSAPDASDLKIVSPNEPTWFTKKVSLLVFDKQLTNSLDHVITNLKSKKCKVLSSDQTRLDVDRTKDGKQKKPFMDHRGVLCDMTLP